MDQRRRMGIRNLDGITVCLSITPRELMSMIPLELEKYLQTYKEYIEKKDSRDVVKQGIGPIIDSFYQYLIQLRTSHIKKFQSKNDNEFIPTNNIQASIGMSYRPSVWTWPLGNVSNISSSSNNNNNNGNDKVSPVRKH